MKYKSTKIMEILIIIALILTLFLSGWSEIYYASGGEYNNIVQALYSIDDVIKWITVLINLVVLIGIIINISCKKDLPINCINLIVALFIGISLFVHNNYYLSFSFEFEELLLKILIAIPILKLLEYLYLLIDEKGKKILINIVKYGIIISISIIVLGIIIKTIHSKINYKEVAFEKYETGMYLFGYNVENKMQSAPNIITNEDELNTFFNIIFNETDWKNVYSSDQVTRKITQIKQDMKIKDEFWSQYFILISYNEFDKLEYNKKENKLTEIHEIPYLEAIRDSIFKTYIGPQVEPTYYIDLIKIEKNMNVSNIVEDRIRYVNIFPVVLIFMLFIAFPLAIYILRKKKIFKILFIIYIFIILITILGTIVVYFMSRQREVKYASIKGEKMEISNVINI